LKPLKRNTFYTSKKHWQSLDEMPLYNWIKCTDGDLQYIRQSGHELPANQVDENAWFKVYNEYIDIFGLSALYKKTLEAMRRKALLELDFVLTREKFKLTEIALQEAKLKTMLNNNGSSMTIDESLIHLSRWLGYHVNSKKITVLEYFNLLKQYGKN